MDAGSKHNVATAWPSPAVGGASSSYADAEEFEELYRQHFAYVYRVARHLGADAESIDDVVQDVFLVVYRRLDEFEGRSSIETWLYGIARRVVARQRRTHSRHRRKVDAFAEVRRAPEDLRGDVQNRDAARILQTFVDSLQPDQRTVFVLNVLEDVTARGCKEAVDHLCDAAGTTANVRGHPLERIARDVRVVTQHVTVAPHNIEDAGRILLGLQAKEAMLAGFNP